MEDRTQRQTCGNSIYHASIASGGKSEFGSVSACKYVELSISDQIGQVLEDYRHSQQ